MLNLFSRDSFIMKEGHNQPVISETQAHLEQLVLYIRVLQLLSSAIQLAQSEMKSGQLKNTDPVKNGSMFLFMTSLFLHYII